MIWVRVVGVVGLLLLVVGVVWWWGGDVVTGVAVALVVGGGVWVFRFAAGRLGVLTGVAVVALCSAALFGVVAAVSGVCPGSVVGGGRCSSGEVGAWVVSGALLPLLLAAGVAPFVLVVRVVRRFWLLFRGRVGR